MKLLRRIMQQLRGLFHGASVDAEMERELASHLTLLEEDLIQHGESPEEAHRLACIRLGGVEQTRMKHRHARGLPLLESLLADLHFGGRQLMKRKVTTAAAVLSLALAIGSCMTAFQLVDTLFLRPLPVNDPAHLYAAHFMKSAGTGTSGSWDWVSYPIFEQMREAVKGQAALTAIGYTNLNELTYGGYQQMEQAYQQPVSGEMFGVLGLNPTLGRLIGPEDDRAQKQSPVAVLSYEYWQRRFGGDPQVIGKRFRRGKTELEVVGVAPKGFTGTELGLMADIFTPTMMENYVTDANDFDLVLFVRPGPGVALSTVENVLDAVYQRSERERAKTLKGLPANLLATYPNAHLALRPVGSGESGLREAYASPLNTLSVLVCLVLLIACANVANLMSLQSAARAREMAIRVSLGAGRRRLVRMVLTESVMLGTAAALLGLVFAWWASPFVVARMTPPEWPIRLALSMDWRAAGFSFALTMAVVLLFGVLPALRASQIQPVRALKGDEEHWGQPKAVYALIAAQVAFCFVVLFTAGLFTTTFTRLVRKPLGFTPDRLLVLETIAQQPLPLARWNAVLDAVRATPGVQRASMGDRTLMGGMSQNSAVTVNGVTRNDLDTFFLKLSPGWIETMGIPLRKGRDVRDSDLHDTTALVNETFVKAYFAGQDAVGRTFTPVGEKTPVTIVGVVGDTAYLGLRESTRAQAYQPIRTSDGNGGLKPMQQAFLLVKTVANDPMELAETLRKNIAQTDSLFRVSKMTRQRQIAMSTSSIERLLAILGGFFAGVALLLATIGLYGVLHYSVVQREREIGIRIALGAAAGNIVRIVSARVFAMVLAGAITGLVLGLGAQQYIASLLYGVKGTDVTIVLLSGAVLLGAAALAAVPAMLRATRIDPVQMLRAD